LLKILIRDDQNLVSIPVESIIAMMKKILEKTDCGDKELSVVFVDDKTIQDINRKFMGRDKPTNVLSFSYEHGADQDYPAFDNPLMGEVVVSVETCARSAEAAGMDPLEEVVFCLIHGIAHLLGYEHVSVEAAISREMETFVKEQYRKYSEIALCK
jgi:probable rRNA maturation factor